MAPRGYLVSYGQLSGALPDVDLGRLMEAGSIFVTKYGHRAGLVRPEHVAAWISEALALATTRPLVSDVAARLPLNRVADAYRALDSGVPGKVLVLPHGDHDSGHGP
jgi:NADPH2:quinone reductase